MQWLNSKSLQDRGFKRRTAVFAACALLSYLGTAALAATPSTLKPAPSILQDQLGNLEQKLLQRTFPLDPEDKRLQRLELLLFGATQMGTSEGRLAELKRAAADRATQSNRSGQQLNNKANISSNIAEIEKYVLKKTNPQLTTSQRLAQLESKVFGQASPGMTIAQRIERLQKTIGLADPSSNPQTAIEPFGSLPNGSFSFQFQGDPSNLDPHMAQILKQLQRQMQQMEPFGGGMPDENGMPDFDFPRGNNPFRYDFRSPSPNESPHLKIIPGKPGAPGSPGFNGGIPGKPGQPGSPGSIFKDQPEDEIPPYGAPNTI
jgi:hypothetical protein